MEKDLAIASEYGPDADILELRVDRLLPSERAYAGRVAERAGMPVILTIRRQSDGGSFEGSEGERISLYERLLPYGFSHVDLEEDLAAPSLEEATRKAECGVIRSLHDPSGIPPDLEARFSRLARSPWEIPKAAVTPHGISGLSRLLRLCSGYAGEKIVIGMGEFGTPLRILAPRLGLWLCYSSAPGMDAAPGHLGPRALSGLYRFRSQGKDTAIFGVIGNPVSHSLSPFIHNRGFSALGIDAVYVPFRVDDLSAFFDAAGTLRISGFSVTIPHKESVREFLSESDSLVRSVGACNTVSRDRSRGTWSGTNTDVEGFLDPLADSFQGKIPPSLRASVIGAGGAGRAVVAALVGSGAKVLVLNRHAARAEELARTFGVEAASLDGDGLARMARYRDLIVQTTSVGMEPDVDADPIEGYRFTGSEIAYDLVYKPAETSFLRRAREAGCRVIPGRRMLLSQAFAQFRIFTGRDYPRELAREILAEPEEGERHGYERP